MYAASLAHKYLEGPQSRAKVPTEVLETDRFAYVDLE